MTGASTCANFGSLLAAVKRKLRIDWDDDATDARLAEDMIPAALETITELTGCPEDFDFTRAGQEQSLFLNLCFYEWNDAADEFQGNFQAEILQCRRKWEVRKFIAGTDSEVDVGDVDA